MSTFVTLIIFRFFNYYHFDPCHISQKGESNILYFRIRLGVPSKKNRPNRREEGQLHFKKLKRNNFLTKVGEGGVTKHFVKNWSTLFCVICYWIWPNQGNLCLSVCTPDPQKVIRIIENVNSKPKFLWFLSKILREGGRSTWSTLCQK